MKKEISVKIKETVYLSPETLYRLGNGSSPLLTKVRSNEVDTIQINSVTMIVANGKGISLYNKKGLDLAPLSGWVWEIKSNTPMPLGLKLIKDDRPEGHYSLCPSRNMPVSEFVSLLEKVVIHCKKAFKKKA
jgi:hypothetical protein